MKHFLDQIRKFNQMYGYENRDTPKVPTIREMENYKSILLDELNEIDSIIDELKNSILPSKAGIGTMVSYADWVGDEIVYRFTHALRFGFPIEKILNAIMISNFSKLDASGKPIYDERGKVLKGPNFFGPEAAIEKILLKCQPEEKN